MRGALKFVLAIGAIGAAAIVAVRVVGLVEPSAEDQWATRAYELVEVDLRSIKAPSGVAKIEVSRSTGECADPSIGEEGTGPWAEGLVTGPEDIVVMDVADQLVRRGWTRVEAATGSSMPTGSARSANAATLSRTTDGFAVTVRVSAGPNDLGSMGTTPSALIVGSSIDHAFCD